MQPLAGLWRGGELAQHRVDHADRERSVRAHQFDTLAERGVRGDTVEMEELKSAEAESDFDRRRELHIGSLEERANARVEGNLPAQDPKYQRRREISVGR